MVRTSGWAFQEQVTAPAVALHTDEIDHHGACPVGRLEQRLDRVNVACVVNQTVQTVARGQNRVGCAPRVCRNAQVAGHGKGGTSVLLHVQQCLCEFFTFTCSKTTVAPAFASSMETDKPMPFEAPVTT